MAAGSSAQSYSHQPDKSRLLRLCGWAVHLYTALGAVLGLIAIDFAARHDFRASFAAMAIATAIDSSDGPLARALQIKARIPFFDGTLLDNIVDYLTYVVAPAFLMLAAEMLPSGAVGTGVACSVVLASAYGFCRTDAKTADNFFLGFPSYWNLVVFYLFCFKWSQVTNAIVVAGFAVMVFVPIKYIYPNRTKPLRRVTLTLGIIWAVVTVLTLLELPSPSPLLLYSSFAFIIYYIVASYSLQVFFALSAARNRRAV